ncbi:nucleotide sugar dehydrogenase [Butyricicoccus faecihominis]|uniref:nucleotide sugar dehydrogenase n=1 Tax=Butyricicoccus faecihominis TaxID=1712515 RepID=UPI002479B4D2|nr:nucleotide sugar dehydrogenase [Butyricicoccus faecihominis]MCQ5131221.1 nucleotide sugar dehydrogenase [Butyricicoccus faecihominis]
MKITVMGLGYIGLPTAITLSGAGFEVCGFDVNQKTIEQLQSGKIHIVEPGLQLAFDEAVAGGHLHFSSELAPSDVFYIAVPTPFYQDDSGAHKADLKYVESAGRMAGKLLKPENLVILESTVPPRTSEMLARVLSEESGIDMDKIHVAHCPERVIPGNMMFELKNNDRIVGARTPEAAEMAAAIYEKVLEKGVVHKTDDLTAEMCKLTENTFRDVNIAYANELSIICDKMGIDVFELIKLANCHPRVNILTPGVGVGGHCIAVDPWFIYEQFPEEAKVIHASRVRNENKPRFVAEKVIGSLAKVTDTVGVLGLSYKPDVDDMRESPSIELCQILKEKGVNFIACDPFAPYGDLNGISNVSFDEILEKADYLVITLGHTLFKDNKELIAKKPFYDCVGLMEK